MTPADFRAVRKRANMTQAELAALLGVASARAVRHWETGGRQIGGPVIRLMRLLDSGHRNLIEGVSQ